MALYESVRAYLSIRPLGLRNALRLYAAYAAAGLTKIGARTRFKCVGLLVRGQGNLRVSIDGNRFEVRPRTNDLDLVSPKHEPLVHAWFQVSASDVVVDVGAHIGLYTLMAARKASKVVAVEPDPSNFQLLERNVLLNRYSNIVLVPLALSSRPGTVVLSLAGRENTGTSAVQADTIAEPADGVAPLKIRVESDTLDHLVDALGLKRIDWLKIDVEGHEVSVLEGGRLALQMTQRMILEVTKSTENACRDIMEGAGFELGSIEEGSPASNWLLWKAGTVPPTDQRGT